MSTDQATARGDYESEVQAARTQLLRELDTAEKTYDAAVLAATTTYAARERAARSNYWGERADSWRTFGQPSVSGWPGATGYQPAIPEGNDT